MTSEAVKRLPILIVRHSRLYSSITLKSLSFLPSEVVSKTKSQGPDVVAVLGPKPDTRLVGEPQPPALGLPGRHFEALGPPDALDSLGVHLPAGHLQKVGDAPIAVTAKATRESDDRRGKGVLVVSGAWLMALC